MCTSLKAGLCFCMMLFGARSCFCSTDIGLPVYWPFSTGAQYRDSCQAPSRPDGGSIPDLTVLPPCHVGLQPIMSNVGLPARQEPQAAEQMDHHDEAQAPVPSQGPALPPDALQTGDPRYSSQPSGASPPPPTPPPRHKHRLCACKQSYWPVSG